MAVLYNPERIGRGIFYNGSKAGEGYYEVRYNIPATRAEIEDFVRLVAEMERRLGRVEMYCVEEERTFTSAELEQGIGMFAAFSLQSLNRFCGNEKYQTNIRRPVLIWTTLNRRCMTCSQWISTMPSRGFCRRAGQMRSEPSTH